MVQRLRKFAVFAGDVGSVPTSSIEALKHLQLHFQGYGVLTPSFVLYRNQVCMWYLFKCARTIHIHIKQILVIKFCGKGQEYWT